MVYEGVVLEINKRNIVVLTSNGDYLTIKYKKGSYDGQNIYFTEEDIYKENKYSRFSAIAALILLILIPTFIFMSLPTNVQPAYAAVMSVDVNPSIELFIDKEERVIDIISLNDDANYLIKSEWIGESYSKVLVNYLELIEEKGYFEDNGVVLFSCIVLDEAIDQDKLRVSSERAIVTVEKEISYAYIEADKETLGKAKEENLSAGKYKLYHEIQQIHPEITQEELKGKRLAELIVETKGIYLNREEDKKDNNKNKDTLKEDNQKNKNQETVKPKNKYKGKEQRDTRADKDIDSDDSKDNDREKKKDGIKEYKDENKEKNKESEKGGKNKENSNNRDKNWDWKDEFQ